ncbi:MAG: M24 family metallopeptidase [Proteobacteria bacterium]|nr:M24 family metallopeptidase [Pseudomonadota bacterium]
MAWSANSRAKLGYDASGSGTKQCGGEFTSGRHLPEEFRGQIWTNQYKAHIVARYSVEDNGAGVTIKGLEPLIRSSSPNFRPVDLKIGPDGAAYILDWYNPLIGHMQHSFRDERRDTTHGRVWRVTYKDRPLVKKPKLVGVPLAELLDHLKDPEDFARHQVKRVLYDANGQEAVAALGRWVKTLDPAEDQFDHHRLEALWCYQTIGVVNEPLLRDVLRSRESRARAAALRVLRYWRDRVADPLALIEPAIVDESPRVRLEAILTLGFIPDKRSIVVAMHALDRPSDRYLDHALKLTVDALQPHWVAAHRAGKLQFDKIEHRNYALSNLLSHESVQVMIDHLNSGSIDAGALAGPAAAVAETANAPQLEPLILALAEVTREYKTSGRDGISPAALTLILDALDRAARSVLGPLARRFIHSLGHGIGLDIHEGPRLASGERTALKAGHMITLEPGVYFSAWGAISLEVTNLVTPAASCSLTGEPARRLPVIGQSP